MSSTKQDYNSLYKIDFFLWSQAVANAIRHEELDAHDRQIVADQISSMGMEKIQSSISLLCNLIMHLMQLSHHVCTIPNNHHDCIIEIRKHLEISIKHSPHLARMLYNDIDIIYQNGVQKYLQDLNIGHYLPSTCPFTTAQLLDKDFFTE